MKNLKTLVFLLPALWLTSCVKDDFDAPPATGSDPDVVANATIADVKALFVDNEVRVIDSNYIVEAVVIADDKSGNFYKSIVLQDATGGINIQIDMSNYYSSYKVGRKVFIKCKGLVIGDYHDLIQLGGYVDNSTATPQVGRIPLSLVPQYLVAGEWDQPFDTLVVSNISALNPTTDQNKLVRLNNVHFATPCQTWADIPGQTSGNRDLLDGSGTIIVRTSNFTTFGNQPIPGDTGSVIGVYQVYDNDLQLVLRNLDDVIMDPPNCIVWGPVNKIRDLRTMFSMGTTTIPAGSVIKGIVISDMVGNNIDFKNIALQDSTGGIIVRFSGANTFALGDEVEVDLGNQVFTEFNRLLQVDAVPNANATKTGTGSVAPRVATASEILANGEAWESTLVTVNAGNFSGGSGIYAGSINFTDASGVITVFTRNAAIFSQSAYPTTTVNITGIVSEFTTGRQLNLRNLGDVQ